MTMKLKFIILITVIELAIISFLGFNAYKKYHDPFLASVHPISKSNIVFEAGGDLEYFYEPEANKTIANKHFQQDLFPYESLNTINSDSLHERFEYSIEKPKETYRIISLGDSFAFGLYLDTKDNYSEILEDMLNNKLKCKNISKFEVINLGVGGYEIDYAVERFKRRGQKYSPDLVLWLVNSDDFTNDSELFQEKFQRYYKEEKAKNREMYDTADTTAWHKAWVDAREDSHQEVDPAQRLKYQEDALYSITTYYENDLLLLLPLPLPNGIEKIVQHFAQSREHTYLNKNTDILSDPSNTVTPTDKHPNKQGSLLIANDIFDYIKSKNIISCK